MDRWRPRESSPGATGIAFVRVRKDSVATLVVERHRPRVLRALACVLITSSALAQPKPATKVAPDPKPPAKVAPDPKPAAKVAPDPKPATPVLPEVRGMSEAQRGIELVPSSEARRDVTRVPSLGGGTSLGMVTPPAWHNDMRPYAEGGMVMRPPATGDHMNVAPGTSGLPDQPVWERWWNVLQLGADRFFELVIPSAGPT